MKSLIIIKVTSLTYIEGLCLTLQIPVGDDIAAIQTWTLERARADHLDKTNLNTSPNGCYSSYHSITSPTTNTRT